MEIKRCNTCGRFLSDDDFNWSDKKKGYKQSCCKKCSRNQAKLSRESNKEHCREYHKQWCENNPEYYKRWEEKNKRYRKEQKKQYAKNNSDKYNVWNAKRRAGKLQATVSWANKKIINYIYKDCVDLNKLYGWTKFHVDHYYPLQSEFVCGLHHENNLQIITAEDNHKKFNKCPKEDINLNKGV